MKFLRLFPRRHFAGKPVETSGDVVKCSLFSEANVTVVTHALVDNCATHLSRQLILHSSVTVLGRVLWSHLELETN